jgi:anaerobic ribonucleoside-triphosphate reductase activating protein
MNYLKIDEFDDKNGDGARMTIFVAGCPHKCEGCFNYKSWSYISGEAFTEEVQLSLFNSFETNREFLAGLSVLGGEPLAPRNRDAVIEMCRQFKLTFPEKNIWLWSGYTLAEIQESAASPILKVVDTLVDGKFEQDLHDLELSYRGSSNQRILRSGEHF